MAVTYATAVKTARLTATRDHFASGTLEILTSGDVLLAAFTLSASGGSVTNDVWTLTWVATTVAAVATGTAAKAQLKTSGAAANLTGLTVGTSGADVILNGLNINSGQDVTINSATITHAA